jgi:hypothetical protein
MTFERKVFVRDTEEGDKDGIILVENCPICNWEAGLLYRIGKSSDEEMCAGCLADLLLRKGYHILGED